MSHRVRLFLKGVSSTELIWMLERQTPRMQRGCFGDLQFVDDDSYDVAVCMNEHFPVRTPPECTICLLMEPPEKMRPQLHDSIGALFSFNDNDRHIFCDRYVHHHMLSFLHATILIDDHPGPHEKPRIMSMIVSGKTDHPYQRHRIALAQALVRSELPIDFYGRDFIPNPNDSRIRGPLPRIDKTNALRDYTYSIACECSPQEGYLSEKFLDCIVNNCVPITNNQSASRHFPSESFIVIDPDQPLDHTVAVIRDLIHQAPRPNPGPLRAAKRMALEGTWSLAVTLATIIAERIDHQPRSVPKSSSVPSRSVFIQEPQRLETVQQDAVTQSVSRPSALVTIAGRSRDDVTATWARCSEIEPQISLSTIVIESSQETSACSQPQSVDMVIHTASPLGIGAFLNRVISSCRSPYLLLLPNPMETCDHRYGPFLQDALHILDSDGRIGQIALGQSPDASTNRRLFDGPFREKSSSVPHYIRNPNQRSDEFLGNPSLFRLSTCHTLGPLREEHPKIDADIETEFQNRFSTQFVIAVIPELYIFPARARAFRQSAQMPGPGSLQTNRRQSLSITFIIPFRQDSPERLDNCRFVHAHLGRCIKNRGWNATIHIAEQPRDGTPFWKCRLINDAVRASTSDIVAVIDADVLIPCQQLDAAILALSHDADVCYPFQGDFLNVQRSSIPRQVDDIELTEFHAANVCNLNPVSVGGAVLYRRTVYWGAGGMNERFVSWGREDVEVAERVHTLGYQCVRVPGPLFHLDHPRTIDSRTDQPHHAENCREFDRISALDRYALIDEIASWEWAKERTLVSMA
jgi:hypothetical protein